jgi:hypothetical protein
MIESNYVWVRGPSIWGIDNRQGDFNFTRHDTDAAPLKHNIPNCRKNNVFRVLETKKLTCGNRKDPTLCGFLKNTHNRLELVEYLNCDQNKNQTYFDNTNAHRTQNLTALNGSQWFCCCIPYKILCDSRKHNMEKRTRQTVKYELYVSTTTEGSRIRREKLDLRIFNPTFLFYSVKVALTITKIRWFFCVQSCKAQQLSIYYTFVSDKVEMILFI